MLSGFEQYPRWVPLETGSKSKLALKTLLEESSPARARLLRETIFHGRRGSSRVCTVCR